MALVQEMGQQAHVQQLPKTFPTHFSTMRLLGFGAASLVWTLALASGVLAQAGPYGERPEGLTE